MNKRQCSQIRTTPESTPAGRALPPVGRSWYRGPKGDVNDPECTELVKRYRELVAQLEARPE